MTYEKLLEITTVRLNEIRYGLGAVLQREVEEMSPDAIEECDNFIGSSTLYDIESKGVDVLLDWEKARLGDFWCDLHASIRQHTDGALVREVNLLIAEYPGVAVELEALTFTTAEEILL